MIDEFITFLQTYNVVWVTLGLIIATKFAGLTKSLIDDLIMPLIFSPLLKKLKVDKLEDLSWRGVLYGKVLATFIDFVIIAFSLFLIVKYMNVEIS